MSPLFKPVTTIGVTILAMLEGIFISFISADIAEPSRLFVIALVTSPPVRPAFAATAAACTAA